MAGQIVVSSIKTDSDNSISFLANTGATIFSANISSGICGSFIENGTITQAKLGPDIDLGINPLFFTGS